MEGTENTDKIEDTPKGNTTVEFLMSLAEENKDNIEYVANIQETLNLIKGAETFETQSSELETIKKENETLKTELQNSKDKFYQTFLKGSVSENVKVEEEEETKTPSVDEVIQMLTQ